VLAVAGGCGVLVTTRRHGDAPADRQPVAPLPADEATQLLKAWAGPRAADETAARRICELVGGLPLAVRLAGRYMATHEEDAADYLAWLETSPLAALDHGRRQADSVPLLIERSLGRVSRPARQALGVIGLLALAPFGREAVAAALDAPEAETGRTLGELVDYGLLLREQRYQVSHPLVHTYARERLVPSAEVTERLAAYYAVLAEEQSARGLPGYAVLDAERAHLVAVLAGCAARGHYEAARRLTWAVEGYLDVQGYWVERVAVVQVGLQAAQVLGDKYGEGAFLNRLGLTYHSLGQMERAIEYHEQALAIGREICAASTEGSPEWAAARRGEGTALDNLGIARRNLGQVERAIEYHQQALAVSREIGDRRGEGTDLGNLGIAYHSLGQVERAIEYYQQALAVSREIGDRRNEGAWLGNLGLAYADLGQVERAIEYYQQALAVSREIGDRRGEAAALGNLGGACRNLGQVERARECLEQALTISREIGDRRGEGNRLGSLGNAYYSLGQVERAIEHYQRAMAISREIGDRRGEAASLGNLGCAYRDLGQVERAIEYHQQALAVSREIGNRRNEGSQLGNLGLAYAHLGQVGRAIEYHQQALAISREIGNRRGEGNQLGNLGIAYRNLGQVERARECLEQALAIFEEIKSPYAQWARDRLAKLPRA
jgi:tetratricopeptide (TPR) repeat protein